ncbi:MAG: hypothetical protein MHPSP_003512, partial [Paramarteilia canceri]
SVTFISSIIYALIFKACEKESIVNRDIIVSVLVIAWAARLGTFLLYRISKFPDARLDQLSKIAFLIAWLIQAAWVLITNLPAMAIMFRPNSPVSLKAADYIGIIVWLIGFGIETIADIQKLLFKMKQEVEKKIENTNEEKKEAKFIDQ